MKSLKRIALFCLAVCLPLSLTLSVPVSAAEWEETYYGTPLDYYAGGEKAISTSDFSFDDWSGVGRVAVNSVEHPENWFDISFEEITFSYALAWDKTHLYLYEEIDKPLNSFMTDTCYPRFYFNTFSTLNLYTYFVQYNYSPELGLYISRAKRGNNQNDTGFAASIGIHGAEIDGKTYIEMAIPWSEMTTASFTPEAGASIKYSLYVQTEKSGTYLFAQDTSALGTSKPWVNASKFLTMHFSQGTPALPVITPKELETAEILKTSYKEINAALGKSYTGTIGTGWANSSSRLLTEGSFQDTNTIAGEFMEGFQPSDFSEGAATKTIDLCSNVGGLYKFEIGSAQIAADNILFPSQVLVYASSNGYHYQLLGTAAAAGTASSSDGGKLKEVRRYALTLDRGVRARYIKVKIYPPEGSYAIVPISEITAVYNADASLFPEESAVVSLGAKINPLQNGLRFGAKYTKVGAKEVKQLGMLLYPTAKLGTDRLDMDYYKANPYGSSNPSGVILMNAVYISASDYRPGKDFKDYESFVYFITLLNIPEANLSVNITAVPFIEYTDGVVVYGEPLVRNYNAVKAAADSIPE